MIRVRMACGHPLEWDETQPAPPVCACGDRRVSRVTAPAPRFVGVARGPSVETTPLPPVAVDLSQKD